nr:SDR family NAD(P)-dependent oxidoreductase [Rhizobium leucaenae]
MPLALDVTDADQVRRVVERAHGHFGRLDVILNNAGYALVGAVEETAEADIKAEFETNFFGTLRVIQADPASAAVLRLAISCFMAKSIKRPL